MAITGPTSAHPAAPSRTGGSFVLGAPISLADFLALPEDEVEYDRDAHGRLVLMSPDDAEQHRWPLSQLVTSLGVWTAKNPPWVVVPEPGIAFDKIYDLQGRLVAPSFLGPAALEPGIACFEGVPGFVSGPKMMKHFSPRGLRLVVEIASPRTWRSDIGEGSADAVDLWRTYLENGVSEYWFLNLGVEGCPVPAGSGLFLAYDPGARAFAALPAEREVVAGDYRGFPVLRSGQVRSQALPGFVLDLGIFLGT